MDGRSVVRVMKALPKPKASATSWSQSIQAILQFESAESNKRVPDEKRSELVGLMRELIEAVVVRPQK
jgi:hypothetical protein